MGSLGGGPSDYNKLKENKKNVHHYFDANTVDISQLNDMSFGEETHSINETTGSMPQIHGKCRSSWLFDPCTKADEQFAPQIILLPGTLSHWDLELFSSSNHISPLLNRPQGC